ncbi:hypothetical protein Droror1_Dr00025803 [Drosera rotundifolia]
MGRKHRNIEIETLNGTVEEDEAKASRKKVKDKRDEGEIEHEVKETQPVSYKKKRKKKERESDDGEDLTNGLVSDCGKDTEEHDGSDQVSEKKKKKKKKKRKKKESEDNDGILRNGSVSVDTKTGEDDTESEGKAELKKKKEKEKRSDEAVNGDEVDGKSNGKGIGEGQDVTLSYDGVAVSGKNVKQSKYGVLKSFDESELPKEVLECCKGFTKPSPVQSHSWPFLLDGRDLIGIASTGSGKTLAFGVPAIMHVLGKRKGNKSRGLCPICLVLSPTRELAQQISDVLTDAGKPCGVKVLCVYGGTSKGPQISALKAGVDIVIGTPGRLKDLIEMGVCHLQDVSFVVLDEADRMLDMGFEPDVRKIFSHTCSVRQMVMFSATWPTAVHELAQEFMDPSPVKVVVGSKDLAANHDVMQIVEVLDDRARDQRLVALLEKYHHSKVNRVLVFVLYKKEAVYIENMLRQKGWKVVSIHGDKDQNSRTRALSSFKDASCPLLIATDVAARGLDIPDVEVVINYSFPLTTEDYVHRIGRTGRAGKKGVAHTFFTQHNKGLAGELVNVLREAGQVVPASLMKFGTHVKKKESKLYGAHFREVAADAPKAKKVVFNDSDED